MSEPTFYVVKYQFLHTSKLPFFERAPEQTYLGSCELLERNHCPPEQLISTHLYIWVIRYPFGPLLIGSDNHGGQDHISTNEEAAEPDPMTEVYMQKIFWEALVRGDCSAAIEWGHRINAPQVIEKSFSSNLEEDRNVVDEGSSEIGEGTSR